jgi:hypothetical protein
MPPQGQPPSGSQESMGQDKRPQSLAPRLTRAPPVASRETHPKSSDSEIPRRLIKVLGLPVPFPTSAWYVQTLSPLSHWTGAHIPCSYHMSIPIKEILQFQHKNLFSRVTSITRLVTVLYHSRYRPIILVKDKVPRDHASRVS